MKSIHHHPYHHPCSQSEYVMFPFPLYCVSISLVISPKPLRCSYTLCHFVAVFGMGQLSMPAPQSHFPNPFAGPYDAMASRNDIPYSSLSVDKNSTNQMVKAHDSKHDVPTPVFWNVAWEEPITMLFLFVSGLSLCIGHHFFNSFYSGKEADDAGSNQFTEQSQFSFDHQRYLCCHPRLPGLAES